MIFFLQKVKEANDIIALMSGVQEKAEVCHIVPKENTVLNQSQKLNGDVFSSVCMSILDR